MHTDRVLTSCAADCKNPKALGSKVVEIDFRQGADKLFKSFDGTTITYDDALGAVYTINKETDAPTVGSTKYIFFGQVDVTVRAAPGKGIVTSFVLQSDDLDEIDWEWVGSETTTVQTNYFSKGCTETYDRGAYSEVPAPQTEFHTYTIKWTPTELQWIIDGNVVRELKNDGSLSGCSGYPQSPMQLRIGTWVAGRKGAPEGTVQWAGGLADFNEGPFKGYYQSIKIQDFMGGRGAKEATEYHYTDKTGSWQSIKVVNNGVEEGDDTTTTTKSATKSSTATKSDATTLSTVTSASASASVSAEPSSAPDASSTDDSNNGPSETDGAPASQSSIPLSAAGKIGLTLGNVAAMGAALVLGSLLL